VTSGSSRPGSANPPSRDPDARKNWTRPRPPGASATTKEPEQAPRLGADLDDLARRVAAGAPRRDAEDGMRPPVEHDERAVGRLTAERQLGEAPGDVRGEAADRSERDRGRGRMRDGDRQHEAIRNDGCCMLK
jgi:hypothetical protein